MARLSIYLLLAFLVGVMTGAWGVGGTRPEGPPEATVGTVSVETTPEPEKGASAGSEFAGRASLALKSSEPTPNAPAVEAFTGEANTAVPPWQTAMQRWARLEAEMVRLNQRVAALEQVKGPADRPSIIAGSISRETNAEEPATPPTEESRRSILVEAGVPEDTAEDIVRRQSEQALARLELRDQATREGWLGSDQYRQSLRELNAEAPDLRGEIDLYAYDRYLYATGEPNRVAVTSVIEGSAAQEAGLLPGDVILSYADERVFGWSDLNSGTTAGERGELVPVEVQREGTLIQAWLPRGPMGIRLESVSLDPDS